MSNKKNQGEIEKIIKSKWKNWLKEKKWAKKWVIKKVVKYILYCKSLLTKGWKCRDVNNESDLRASFHERGRKSLIWVMCFLWCLRIDQNKKKGIAS